MNADPPLLENTEQFGGPLAIVRSAFKAICDAGEVRKIPPHCRCLYAIAKHAALANHLSVHGLALPNFLQEEMDLLVSGRTSGAGCRRHWERGELRHQHSVYYILVPPHFVKVGHSEWPYRRLGQLRSSGLGDDAHFMAMEPGAKDVEQLRHAEFKVSRYRLLGQDGGTELFELDNELVERIRGIAEANGMLREPKHYGGIRKA